MGWLPPKKLKINIKPLEETPTAADRVSDALQAVLNSADLARSAEMAQVMIADRSQVGEALTLDSVANMHYPEHVHPTSLPNVSSSMAIGRRSIIGYPVNEESMYEAHRRQRDYDRNGYSNRSMYDERLTYMVHSMEDTMNRQRDLIQELQNQIATLNERFDSLEFYKE